MASVWARDQILACDTEELIDFLKQHGFNDCIETFRKRDIDGELFLKLDQSKLKFWKHDLPSRRVEDLTVFVEKVKSNPENYVERKTVTRKPNVPSKPLNTSRNVEIKKSPMRKQSDISNSLVKNLKPKPPLAKKPSTEDLPISSQLKLALEKRNEDRRARNNQWNQNSKEDKYLQPETDRFERQTRKKYTEEKIPQRYDRFDSEEVEYANQEAETDEVQYINHELETEEVEYANYEVEKEIKSRETFQGRKKTDPLKNKQRQDKYETETEELYGNQDIVESDIGRRQRRDNMKYLEFFNKKAQSELERIQQIQKDDEIIENESFDDEEYEEDDDADDEPEHIYDKVEENETKQRNSNRSHKNKPSLKSLRDSELGWPSFDEDDDNDNVSSQSNNNSISRNNNNEQPNSANQLQNEIKAKLNQFKLQKSKNSHDETLPIQKPRSSPVIKHSNQSMEEPSSTWRFQKFPQSSAINQTNHIPQSGKQSNRFNPNVSSKQYKTNISLEDTKRNRKNSNSRQRGHRDIVETSDKYNQNRHLAVPTRYNNSNKSINRDSQSSTSSSMESINISENPIPLPPRLKAPMKPKINRQPLKNSNFMSSTSSIDSNTSKSSKGSTSKERISPVNESFHDDESEDSDSYIKPALTPDIIKSIRRPIIEPSRNEPNLPNLTMKRPLPKVPIHQYEYFHDITRAESEKTLKGRKDGTFIFRPSRQKDNVCVLCVIHQNKVYHIPVRPLSNGNLALGLQKENEQNFSNLYEIVSYFNHEQLALIREGEKIGTVILLQGISRV